MTASRHRTAPPRLAFRELGSGPDTVVLLHSLGADGRMWDATARLLFALVVSTVRGDLPNEEFTPDDIVAVLLDGLLQTEPDLEKPDRC